MRTLPDDVAALIDAIEPGDEVEASHRAEALSWVGEARPDLFRRVTSPVAPARHLVSYFVVTHPPTDRILLGDHRKAGLWLPPGGHVEVGEHPVDTVRRECREELRVEASFAQAVGARPLFIAITETAGSTDVHEDVSLWFCLSLDEAESVQPDPREYRSVRWWSAAEVQDADPCSFDPHLGRFLAKLESILDPHPAPTLTP